MDTTRILNELFLPLKLILPQAIVEKIPFLISNKEIRYHEVLKHITVDMYCLDIGCGQNYLIQKHKERGGAGIGIDVYPWPGVDEVVEDTRKLPFENESFDCVTCVSALNHIPYRKETMQEIVRVLKAHGLFIVTFLTPFISHVWHKIWKWDDRDQLDRGMKEGEVYGFTHHEMRSLVESAGLKVEKRLAISWNIKKIYVCRK